MSAEGLVVNKISQDINTEYKLVKGAVGRWVGKEDTTFKRPSKKDTEKEQSSGLVAGGGVVRVSTRRGSGLSDKCH